MDQKVEILKVAMVGYEGSGKTATRRTMVEGIYPEDTKHTIVSEFAVLQHREKKDGLLQIWDISGTQIDTGYLKASVAYTSIYTIFIDSRKTIEQNKTEIQKITEILANMRIKQPAQLIIVLSKADKKSQKVMDGSIYDVRKELSLFLLTLPLGHLKNYGICHISAKDNNIDSFKNLLFQAAEKQLENPQEPFSSPDKLRFFPKSYHSLIDEHTTSTTLRKKLVDLFDDYWLNWGFHWRHHYEEADYLANTLSKSNLNIEQCLKLINGMFERMKRNPDFNIEGSFSRRLQYALQIIKIINDEDQQKLANTNVNSPQPK